jgi:peptidoglycan/LPS O-acetylase OafA/YrhL
MRAFAALSVAIFHFSNYYNGQQFLIQDEHSRNLFVYGAQGVEIFYLISGFIIPYALFHSKYQLNHFFSYMGKRLSRLLPPYITTIILIQIIGILLCTYLWGCEHDINFRQIVINVFFLADLFPNYDWINPIFATLEVELQFYLLIGLLFPLFKLNKFLYPVICLSILGLGILTTQTDTVLVNSPFFILGMTVFFIKEKSWKWEYIVVLIGIFVSLISYYMWQDFIAAALGFSLLFWLPENFRFLNFTGKISYSYYLVHGLSGGWFLYFVSDTGLGLNYPVIAIILALIISWITAFLMYLIIEKPSILLSKRIKYGK